MNAPLYIHRVAQVAAALVFLTIGTTALPHPDPFGGQMNARLIAGPHAHPPAVPAGQYMQSYVLATKRWADAAKTQVSYCASPRIEVAGTQPWSTAFEFSLIDRDASSKTGSVLAVATVPTPIPAGAWRELGTAPEWCVLRDANAAPPRLAVRSVYGNVNVHFGPPLPR